MQMSRSPQRSRNRIMRFRTYVAAGLAALASACAGHLDTSAPTYVSPSTFENLTCRQIGEEQKRITRAEATGGRLDNRPGGPRRHRAAERRDGSARGGVD